MTTFFCILIAILLFSGVPKVVRVLCGFILVIAVLSVLLAIYLAVGIPLVMFM